MTLIIGVKGEDGIYFGSDGLTCSGDTVYDTDSEKIRMVNGHVFGCAGYASTKELMVEFLTGHKLKKTLDLLKAIEYIKDKVENIQFQIIINIGERLYIFDHTGYIKEITTHHCIGSGEDMGFILKDGYDETIDIESYIKYTIDKVSKRCVSVGGKILTLKIPYATIKQQTKNNGFKKKTLKKKQ